MVRRGVFVVVLAVVGSIALLPATAGAGGGCTDVMSGESAVVDLKGFCLIPALVRVPAGTKVTFENLDEVDHVIVGSGMAWGSDGTMRPGDSFAATFERDGVYPFQCYIHPGMVGAVLVGDANGKGAATSFGVTVVPPDGGSAVADSNGTAAIDDTGARVAPQASSAWWPAMLAGILVGVVAAAALGLAIVRSRREPRRRPAAT